VSPLLAVADALRERAPDAMFLFLGGRRGLEADLVPASGIAFHATPMPSLRDPDSRLSLITRALLLPLAFGDALLRIVRFRPSVCFTTGGLVSFPVVLAAAAWRVPVLIWTGDVIPGRANRALARVARRVATTFPEAERHLPRGKALFTGNPIRRSLLRWRRPEARTALGLDEGEVVLVSGGSQGSERINEVLLGALERILRRATVIHLTGGAHIGRAEAKKAALPADVRARYRPYAFLRDEMGAALASADLVVGRASSSSIAESLAFGIPLVLIPFRAAAEAHQEANARAVVESGAASIVRESQLDAERLVAEVVGLLNDPGRMMRMSSAAKALGKPRAAEVVADELLRLGSCA
jgi:UDP-N-acetylglucosamine--N-acetylmuramyl-(pentapeptide) pyrophosphoryl-undecaprenol N-acetylglucosamine transferase